MKRRLTGALAISLALASWAALQTWSSVQADRARQAAETAEADADRAREDAEEAREAALRNKEIVVKALVAEKDEAAVAANIVAERAERAEREAELALAESRRSEIQLLNARLQEGTRVATTEALSRVIVDDAAKTRLLWRLVERLEAERRGRPVETTFVNPRGSAVRILVWSRDGHERPLGVVEANGRLPLDLLENDLWIVRVVATHRLVDTGIVGGASTVRLSD